MALPILTDHVERNILLIRGHRVMLDSDLAILYGVPTKRLNEQVMRNKKRFPSDFMFQLTAEEVKRLRSQFATLKPGRGQHRKYRPYVFTEQGVAMLSSVLHSERARASIVHGASWRNRGEALRDRRVEPRENEAYSCSTLTD